MNIHHLELFYHVARNGGISEAVRRMPYGIQQPAVSGQILQLEEFLGVTLFQRRPFALSPPGEKLFRFIEPFFANLESLTRELQGGTPHQLRIGASGVILRDHLPGVMQRVRSNFPGLKITLREGYEPDLHNWIGNHEIDFAITVIEKQRPRGIHARPIVELPLVLLVDERSPYCSAEELWKMDRISEPLISLPPTESMCRHFQHGLQRRKVDWFPSIEVSSVELIETYVAGGFGIGLSVAIPHIPPPNGVRLLPLRDFTPISIGALWRDRPTPLMEALLAEMELQAQRFLPPENKGPATITKPSRAPTKRK